DVWLPLTQQAVMEPNDAKLDNRGTNWLLGMGRLKPGFTIEQAAADLAPLLRRSITENPVPGNPAGSDLSPVLSAGRRGFSAVRGTYSTPLKILMVGVALLLAIACANVANLLLARAIARSKEMSVRMAIGAGRERLMRQLFTESLLLGLLGGIAGLVGA